MLTWFLWEMSSPLMSECECRLTDAGATVVGYLASVLAVASAAVERRLTLVLTVERGTVARC